MHQVVTKSIASAALAGIVALALSPAQAALSERSGIARVEAFNGRWQAQDGAVLTIQVRHDTLEIWGSDNATSFHTRCLADYSGDTASADCIGEGYNFITRRNFTYSSTVVVEGETLTEKWIARFFDASGEVEAEFRGEQEFLKPPAR